MSTVLELCATAGVREFCVCAGARNIELVVGLERSTGCQVWHFFEERSAAFFALGRMMGTGAPVAVVTTSGTAVAELLPATVEAYYQSLPLVLITADRPERFRGSGAPQAIEQVGIFGNYARSIDTFGIGFEAAISGGVPSHINVCLEEPSSELVENIDGVEFCESSWSCLDYNDAEDRQLEKFLEGSEGLVVLLGNLRADEQRSLRDFLIRLGAPVWAEAGSDLREALPGLIVREIPTRVNKVLRIGGVPSLRFWRDLDSLPEIEVFSVSRGGFSGLARESQVVRAVDWREQSPEPIGFSCPLDDVEFAGEALWFQFLSEAIPEGSKVYLGNSLPIRHWNQAATFDDRRLWCHSSRGANGIDGQLSMFFGLSEGFEESWAIVGDLTALYDLSAPWALRELSGGRRRLVVINNGGGRIFSKLPALEGLADGERRAIENDHGVSLKHWAAMWGMGYVKVESEADFVVDDAVASLVIEIFVGGGV